MFGLSQDFIEKKIRENLLKGLRAKGQVTLKGVGTLRKLADGTLRFDATKEFGEAVNRRDVS